MRRSLILLAAVPILAAAPVSAKADVKVEKTDYNGWANSYRLSNGTVELVVVPQVGRIMRYAYPGKPNMLWENSALAGKPPMKTGWTNYGGDKVWPAPQSVWNWPPDPDLDGSAWTAETIPNGVRITSPASKKLKLRFVREITMSAFGTGVHIKNRMDNLGPRREISPWQITQIDDPYSVFMPTEPVGQNPAGWRIIVGQKTNSALHHPSAQGLRIERDKANPYKFGGFSTAGELTASHGTTVFHMKTKVYRALSYPDGGSPLEIFTSPDPDKYVELELLGPLSRLDTGEGAYLEVDWRLTEGK